MFWPILASPAVPDRMRDQAKERGRVRRVFARSPSHSEGRSLEDSEPDEFSRGGLRGPAEVREARNALSLPPRSPVSGFPQGHAPCWSVSFTSLWVNPLFA